MVTKLLSWVVILIPVVARLLSEVVRLTTAEKLTGVTDGNCNFCLAKCKKKIARAKILKKTKRGEKWRKEGKW